MLVNEWVETVWNVIQIRPKTLHDYKRLYKRHLMPAVNATNYSCKKLLAPDFVENAVLTIKEVGISGHGDNLG